MLKKSAVLIVVVTTKIFEFLHPAAYCHSGTQSFKNTPLSSSISSHFWGVGRKKQPLFHLGATTSFEFIDPKGGPTKNVEKNADNRVISGQQSCRLATEINGKWSLDVSKYEIDKKMDKNKSCLKFDRQPAITWVTGSKLGPFSSSTANWNIFHSIISSLLRQQLLFNETWDLCLVLKCLPFERLFCLHCFGMDFLGGKGPQDRTK